MSTAAKETPAVTNSSENKEKGKSDDKLIGNRKVRTILLCSCIFGFCLFAAGYVFLISETSIAVKNEYGGGAGCTKHCPDGLNGMIHGANCFCAGLVFLMLFTLILAISVCIPTCDPSKYAVARLPALGLLLGAALYLFGWVFYISKHKQLNYDDLDNDSLREDQDALYLSWFGEALLCGATAILLAIDLLIPSQHLFESEGKRLFTNLGILAISSILIMPAYFLLAGDGTEGLGPTQLGLKDDKISDEGGVGFGQDGAAVIGTGYIFIFITCVVYAILYFAECCKCQIADKCCTRVLLALGLVIGGLITALGYWIYAGEGVGDKGDASKAVAYYVGYTGLVGGLCAIWALDIAWDDVKASAKING